MGRDIHIYAEKRDKLGQWKSFPRFSLFQDRNYFVFSFFAGVHKKIKPIFLARGLPEDISKTASDKFKKEISIAHTPSWISMEELLKFNYDEKVYEQPDPRQGTYKDFLESDYFNDLKKMEEMGVERIVFWFIN